LFFVAVDNCNLIAQLEAVLASGLKSHTVDGQTTTYTDARVLRAEIERLKREDTVNGYRAKPRVRTVRLGGF
jgi:hypothetical protein